MSVTTESIQQQIPAYLRDAYDLATKRAAETSNQPYQPYHGQRQAPLPYHIQQAMNLTDELGLNAPYFRASRDFGERASHSFPNHYRAYLDPYQDSINRNIASQGNRIFKEKILPELDARYIQLGQYGSSRHAKLAKRAARDIQREISSHQEDALSRAYAQAMQGFNLDRARALEGAGAFNKLAMSTQASQIADIQALREAGLITQEQAQKELDQAYEDWKEERRHPYESLEGLFSLLNGIPRTPNTFARREVQRPSETWHSRDWRDVAGNMGMNMLGNILFGR